MNNDIENIKELHGKICKYLPQSADLLLNDIERIVYLLKKCDPKENKLDYFSCINELELEISYLIQSIQKFKSLKNGKNESFNNLKNDICKRLFEAKSYLE